MGGNDMKRSNINYLLEGYFGVGGFASYKITSFLKFAERFDLDWFLLGEAINDNEIEPTLDSAYNFILWQHFVGIGFELGILNEMGYDFANLSDMIDYKWNIDTGIVKFRLVHEPNWNELKNIHDMERQMKRLKTHLILKGA